MLFQRVMYTISAVSAITLFLLCSYGMTEAVEMFRALNQALSTK